MTGLCCLISCVNRATSAGSAPTVTCLKLRPSPSISCLSFWTYEGSPPRNIPCEHDRLLPRHVLLVLVDVLPVLEHGVDLPVRHRLVDGDLGDLRHLDLAPELLLEHVLRHVRVGGRPGPRLLVQRH